VAKQPSNGLVIERTRRDEVMKVVEGILIRYSDTPINIAETLLTAVTDSKHSFRLFVFAVAETTRLVGKFTIINTGGSDSRCVGIEQQQ
jgi:hypothetical protein